MFQTFLVALGSFLGLLCGVLCGREGTLFEFLLCSLVSGFWVLFVLLFCLLWVFGSFDFLLYLFFVAVLCGLLYFSF